MSNNPQGEPPKGSQNSKISPFSGLFSSSAGKPSLFSSSSAMFGQAATQKDKEKEAKINESSQPGSLFPQGQSFLGGTSIFGQKSSLFPSDPSKAPTFDFLKKPHPSPAPILEAEKSGGLFSFKAVGEDKKPEGLFNPQKGNSSFTSNKKEQLKGSLFGGPSGGQKSPLFPGTSVDNSPFAGSSLFGTNLGQELFGGPKKQGVPNQAVSSSSAGDVKTTQAKPFFTTFGESKSKEQTSTNPLFTGPSTGLFGGLTTQKGLFGVNIHQKDEVKSQNAAQSSLNQSGNSLFPNFVENTQKNEGERTPAKQVKLFSNSKENSTPNFGKDKKDQDESKGPLQNQNKIFTSGNGLFGSSSTGSLPLYSQMKQQDKKTEEKAPSTGMFSLFGQKNTEHQKSPSLFRGNLEQASSNPNLNSATGANLGLVNSSGQASSSVFAPLSGSGSVSGSFLGSASIPTPGEGQGGTSNFGGTQRLGSSSIPVSGGLGVGSQPSGLFSGQATNGDQNSASNSVGSTLFGAGTLSNPKEAPKKPGQRQIKRVKQGEPQQISSPSKPSKNAQRTFDFPSNTNSSLFGRPSEFKIPAANSKPHQNSVPWEGRKIIEGDNFSKEPELKEKDQSLFSFQGEKDKKQFSYPVANTSNPTKATQNSHSENNNDEDKMGETINNSKVNPNTFPEVVRPKPSLLFSKQKQGPLDPLIDQTTFEQIQKTEKLPIFLQQRKRDIIESVKLLFTIQKGPFKETSTNEQGQASKFVGDFTNLFIRTLSLQQKSSLTVKKLFIDMLKTEKYQDIIFTKDGGLNIGYFQQCQIYWQDYTGHYILNEKCSRQVSLLLQKLISKFFSTQLFFLNVLHKYSDLLRPPSDIFQHLFLYLLSLQTKKNQIEVKDWKDQVADLDLFLKKNIIDLLNFYNSKLNKNYKLLRSQKLTEILRQVEQQTDKKVIKLALNALLNHFDLGTHNLDIKSEISKVILESRSLALLPFRVIISKTTPRHRQREELVPSLTDLYQYIDGDEWVDWLEIYTAEATKEGLELQIDQLPFLIKAITSLSPKFLLDRLLNRKKGIAKLFSLIKQDGEFADHFYSILTCCIHSEESLRQIEEIYLKRISLNYEFKDIVELITNFPQNTQNNKNEEVPNLENKLTFLLRIIRVNPQKLISLERIIFSRDTISSQFKRARSQKYEQVRRGQKIVHLLLDTINYCSIKQKYIKLLPEIFRALVTLLKNKKNQKFVLECMSSNRPSFNFLQNGQIDKNLLNALNEFIEYLLTHDDFYDLVVQSYEQKSERIQTDMLYPLRYMDKSYYNVTQSQKSEEKRQTFSLYWISHLLKVFLKQPFNPYLLNIALQKFQIIPYQDQLGHSHEETSSRYLQSLGPKIPTIFEMLIKILNNCSIWGSIARNLDFKTSLIGGEAQLTSRVSSQIVDPDVYRKIYYSLKLTKTILTLNELLHENQDSHPQHFVIKALGQLKVFSKVRASQKLQASSGEGKEGGNLIMAILSNAQPNQEIINSTFKNLQWQITESSYGELNFATMTDYLKKNKQNLDFEQATNFMRHPRNKYYEAEENVTSLCLDILILLLRSDPESSIEYAIAHYYISHSEQDRIRLTTNIKNKFIETILYYTRSSSHILRTRSFEFLLNLKYKLGKNTLNKPLADEILARYLKHSTTERANRANTVLVKLILCEMQEEDFSHEHFGEQTIISLLSGFKFVDSLLNQGQPLKDTRDISQLLQRYRTKQYELTNVNQIERIAHQRNLVQIGEIMDSLSDILQILIIQLLRKKNSQFIGRSLNLANGLLARFHLPLFASDFASKSPPGGKKSEQPRLFLRDPLEYYLLNIKNSNRKVEVQEFQKNNLIEWAISIFRRLSQNIGNYLKLLLTIDRYFYSNNPIEFTTERLDLQGRELFCHLALGKISFTAIQLFGKSQSEAIGNVQIIGQNIYARVCDLREKEEQGNISEEQYSLVSQGLQIVGYCLEWLRARKRAGQEAAASIIRRISRNMALLPPKNQVLCAPAIKVLISVLSIAPTCLSPSSRLNLREAITNTLFRFTSKVKEYQDGKPIDYSLLAQYALTLYLLVPPQRHELPTLQLVASLWEKETNPQFFFNQSRLLLELCQNYPEEVAKLKVLSRCQIVAKLPNNYARYQDKQRKADSIAWVWTLKIAATLANQPESIVITQQISTFIKIHKEKIYNVLGQTENKVTKGFVQDLDAILELLAAIFTQELWVSLNRNILQEITYLLSHRLIKLLVSYSQGKMLFIVGSSNDKNLDAVKPLYRQESQGVSRERDTQQSLFHMEIELKMLDCLRNYAIVMNRAFKLSLYIENYFQKPVFENLKYFNTFWDSYNKNLLHLITFSFKQIDQWKSLPKLDESLILLYECYNAPYTFVENGYLSCINFLPRTQQQVTQKLYLLGYLIGQLGAVHFIKEKRYANKFNTLMMGNIDLFGKRLKDQLKNFQKQSQKLIDVASEYVNESSFLTLIEIVEEKLVY